MSNGDTSLFLNRTVLRKAVEAHSTCSCPTDCKDERATLRRDATSLAQALKVLHDFHVDQTKTVEALIKLVNSLCVDFGIPKRHVCTGAELLQTLDSSLKVLKAEKYALGKMEPASDETSNQTTTNQPGSSSSTNAPERIRPMISVPAPLTKTNQGSVRNASSSSTQPPLKRPRYTPAQNGFINGSLPHLMPPPYAVNASTSRHVEPANGLLTNGLRHDKMSAAGSCPGSRSESGEVASSNRRADEATPGTSASSIHINTVATSRAPPTLVAMHGGDSDCNLYRDRTKLYLSVSPAQFDTRMHTLPVPRLRSLHLIRPATPKIHALKMKALYDEEYCNLQVTVDFDYQLHVQQMIHLAYYLRSGRNASDEHNKWAHHPPFRCTARGNDSRMSLTIRFRDTTDEFDMIMISVRMDSGHMGSTQFTTPVVVRLGRPLAGNSVNADIDFFLPHLAATGVGSEDTGDQTSNNSSTHGELIILD